MLHPFDQPRNLTAEQWKARARAIQARLEGLSIDELMRGDRVGGSPRLGVQGQRRGGYDPNQPRVPTGHSDGGQWTDDERWASRRLSIDRRDRLRGALQLAAGERPPLDPRKFALWLARKGIEKIYRELASWDLFGYFNPDNVTVAVTTVAGKDYHGTSSEYGDWTAIDDAEARRLRAVIVGRFPHSAGGRTLGQYPLDAFFHAETQVLLRAARENGGTLANHSIEVFVDGQTCSSCRRMLGHIVGELGNPIVTFTNAHTGKVMGVVRGGRWRPR